ncbi:hypothetical protein Ccrd_015291 [Cynara cardunculus var. scolymus]|uniref:Uncharacterized protein n=1 Tax=Cynara cardunculus var. scolymus TaxID=59895 RepID=A0A103YC60_CYNCS|nr:hypothetical protein Ccrd_015291 [Cynara cardunculus var. scolymus]
MGVISKAGDLTFKAFTLGLGVATIYLGGTFSVNVYRGLAWHKAQSSKKVTSCLRGVKMTDSGAEDHFRRNFMVIRVKNSAPGNLQHTVSVGSGLDNLPVDLAKSNEISSSVNSRPCTRVSSDCIPVCELPINFCTIKVTSRNISIVKTIIIHSQRSCKGRRSSNAKFLIMLSEEFLVDIFHHWQLQLLDHTSANKQNSESECRVKETDKQSRS